MGNPLERFVQAPSTQQPTNSLEQFLGTEGGVAAPVMVSDSPEVLTPEYANNVAGILQKVNSDKSARVATLRALLSRQDISPPQRERVQRLLDMEKENFFTNAREEDRSAVNNFFRGMADAAVRFGAIGSADLAVAAASLPFRALSAVVGKDLNPLEGLRETTRGGMEAAKLLVDPEGKAGFAGQVAGVLGSAVAGGSPLAAAGRAGAYGRAALNPWAVLNSAGMRAVAARSPAAAAVIKRGTEAGATFGQRWLAQLVGGGAVDAVAAIDIATGPGDLDDKVRALLIQTGISVAAGGGAAIPRPKPGAPKPIAEELPPKEAPTMEQARAAVADAKENLGKARRSRAAEIAHSWNSMTPDQRKQIVPGLSIDEYGTGYGKLDVERKKMVRTAIEELMPAPVDVSTRTDEIAQLKAENDKLRATVSEQVGKRREAVREVRAERRRANTDALTELSSPAMLKQYLKRNPGGFWAAFDVASLKAMNDANSHEAGDQLLIRAAESIKAAAKGHGLDPRNAFRQSGDEFLLHGTDKATLEAAIESAVKLYGETPVPNSQKRTKLYGAVVESPGAASGTMKALREGEAPEFQRAGGEPITKLSKEPTPDTEPATGAEPRPRSITGKPAPELPRATETPPPEPATRASEASTQQRSDIRAREAWIDAYVTGGKRTRETGQRAWRGLTPEQQTDVAMAVAEGKTVPHVTKLAKPKAAKPIDPVKALDDIEDGLDRQLDNKEITEAEYGRLWTQQVAEPRAKLNKALALEQARTEEPSMADVTPEDVAVADAANGRRFPELSMDETTLRMLQQRGKAVGGPEGLQMQQMANIALRFGKVLTNFDNEKLNRHMTEMKAMLGEATDVERELIKARMGEVQAELSRRSGPNMVEFINNERGSILPSPEGRNVFQKKVDVPDYEQPIHDMWVKGHGLNKTTEVINEAMTNPTQSWADLWYNTRRKLQNAQLPIREISALIKGEGKLQAFDDPYVWAQLFSGWATRADTFLFGKPFHWDASGNIVESNIRGLRQVIGEVGGSYDNFVNYLIALRELETGRTGVPKVNAERVVANAPEQFVGWAREVSMYSDNLLKYAADAGLVSGKSLELLTQLYKNYIPLHRVFEGEAVASPVQKVVGPRSMTTRAYGAGRAIYKLTGSQQKIVDPIQAIVENTRRLIRDADMNRVSSTLYKAVQAEPEKFGGIMEIIKDEKHFLSHKNQKLFSEFKEQIKELVPDTDDQTIAQLFDSLNRERLGRKNDVLIAYVDGKRRKMRVRSDVAEAFGAMSPKHMEWYVQLLAAPTKLLKGGIVLNPLFSPLAFFKDIFEASARSRYGFKPWDSFVGLGVALSDNPVAKIVGVEPSAYLKEFRSGGGAFTALSGVEARTAKAAYDYTVSGRGVKSTLVHPIDALKRWARPFEEAARLGEFRRARLQGASVLEASVAARNVTVDFTQAGTTMQALNLIFPFLNPAVQSLTADFGALRRNPARVLAVGTGLALGSLMLAAANEDDQEINDLRKTPYGSLFWWFRGPDGVILKMPKPYFFGQLFATGAERAWDEMKVKDPNSARRWRDAVIEQVTYTSMPALAQWGAALYANKLPFTGSPIESEELRELDPAFRVTPRTSGAAQGLAGAANAVIENLPIDEPTKYKLQVSPIRVDALLGMAVGTIGRDIRGMLQYMSKTKEMAPEPVAADLPVVGRLFGRYPSSNVEPLYYFYERAERTESVVNTLQMLIEHRPEEFDRYLNEHVEDYIAAGVLAGTRESMADVRASIKAIEQLDGLDPKSKREMIDDQLRIIIEMARVANEVDRSVTTQDKTSRLPRP